MIRLTPLLGIAELLLTGFLTAGSWKPVRDNEEYRVNRIPKELLHGADAIVRKHITGFDIVDERRSRMTVTMAVTVFTKTGQSRGELLLWYDAFRTIDDLEGTIFDADGEKLRSLNSRDIKDQSAFEDYSLYEDSRVRFATLYENTFPYTVEYVYTIDFSSSLNWPTWYAQESNDAVELSRFEVRFPTDLGLRTWCNVDSMRPTVSTNGRRSVYTWEMVLLPKFSNDVAADFEDITTIVKIAPHAFTMEHHDGSMRSWKEFGLWFRDLSSGRDRLPEKAVQDMIAIVDPNDSPRTRIEKVYRYLQSRTRYVSVQLGIGGWQPFDATYVHERGYGDCKALTNYASALLKQVGVQAYPVLIRNGSYRFPMITEFPSNQFNHVILCVPLERDSVWLECTSQSIPTGHIGRSNEDRPALFVGPEGGVVVKTPASTARDNMQIRSSRVFLSATGNALVRAETIVTGNQQDYVRAGLQGTSQIKREQWIHRDLPVPNAELLELNVTGLETHDATATVTVSLSIPRLASVSGSRIFFQPNLFGRRTDIPADVVRLSPVRLQYPYCDSDSISYSLPPSFTPEALPSPVSIESSFGRFATSATISGDTLLVFQRVLEMHQRVIPAAQYAEYRKFFLDVAKADRAQVVLNRR